MKLPFVSRELWEASEKNVAFLRNQLEVAAQTHEEYVASCNQKIWNLEGQIDALKDLTRGLTESVEVGAKPKATAESRFAEPRVLTGMEAVTRAMQIRDKRTRGA